MLSLTHKIHELFYKMIISNLVLIIFKYMNKDKESALLRGDRDGIPIIKRTRSLCFQDLSLSNCVNMLSTGDFYNTPSLKQAAINFIIKNYLKLSNDTKESIYKL